MSFEIKELAVHSTDNIHTLIGKIYIPDGEIKGLFHIVRGMTISCRLWLMPAM